MQLEDYFEFEKHESKFGPVERIRVKGHRISIEHVIEAHEKGASPREIVRDHYPSLSMEEVLATLTYYLHEKDRVTAYIRRVNEVGDKHYQEWNSRESDAVDQRLRALMAEQETGVPAGG